MLPSVNNTKYCICIFLCRCQFQPIFVLFVAISAILHCMLLFQDHMSLVGIFFNYPIKQAIIIICTFQKTTMELDTHYKKYFLLHTREF